MSLRPFTIAVVAVAALALGARALADQNPTYKGAESAAERAFVASIQADLGKRFATTKDAQAAGYFRYTNEDDTGAISYANLQWTSQDPKHPSQLWYDKNGNLLGADFSEPASSTRPAFFGVNPGRWYQFDAHVHYVTVDPATGKLSYDHYIMADKFKAAGFDPAHPTVADLVKMGKVKSTADVAKVFEFPAVWDLIVWIKPNPSGAFAYKNPTVKP